MKSIKSHGILLLITLLLGGVSLMSAFQPASAQADQPTATPTPNIVPTLQSVIATQEVRISELEHKQQRKLDDLTFEISKQVYYVSGIATVIVLAAGFFGLRTYKDIDNIIKEKIKASIDKEYQNQIKEADLQLVPVWVRDNAVLVPVMERLKLYGLQNISTFTFYTEDLTMGITIIPIQNQKDEEEFQKFIASYENKLDPNKTAFILYTGKYIVSEKTINVFPNLTLANMPATVGMALISIGKTLRNVKKVEAK